MAKAQNILEKGKRGWVHVGRALRSRKIFIGFPQKMYDRAKLPLTRSTQHIMEMDEDTARWLIGALRKELANDQEGDVEEYMDA